jgi:hypothetical protein
MGNSNLVENKVMKWYHYIMAFLSGAFLTNAIPHFVSGVSGNLLPTPFANPPGKGLSSPLINVLWAFFNFLVGYLIFRFSRMDAKNKLAMIIFVAGVVWMSIMLSISFMDKVK